MATSASTLDPRPTLRPFMVGLWLAAVAVVLGTVLAAALIIGRAAPTDPTSPTFSVTNTGPGAPAHQPLTVNGNVCAQCR